METPVDLKATGVAVALEMWRCWRIKRRREIAEASEIAEVP